MKSLLDRVKERRSSGGAREDADAAPSAAVTTAADAMRHEHAESRQDKDALIVLLDEIDVQRNVRRHFSEDRLNELADDIDRNGQHTPVVVERRENGRYLLIAGERRYRAKRILAVRDPVKHASIRATLRPETEGEIERRWLQLSENIQREDLNPLDEARAIQENIAATSLTQEEAARRLNKPQSFVSRRLGLLGIDDDLLRQVEAGELGMMPALKAQRQRGSAGAQPAPAADREQGRARTPRVPVPLEHLMQICEIYAAIARQHGLADITLGKKPSRKELLAVIEQRTGEIRGLFDAQ